MKPDSYTILEEKKMEKKRYLIRLIAGVCLAVVLAGCDLASIDTISESTPGIPVDKGNGDEDGDGVPDTEDPDSPAYVAPHISQMFFTETAVELTSEIRVEYVRWYNPGTDIPFVGTVGDWERNMVVNRIPQLTPHSIKYLPLTISPSDARERARVEWVYDHNVISVDGEDNNGVFITVAGAGTTRLVARAGNASAGCVVSSTAYEVWVKVGEEESTAPEPPF